MKDFSKSNFVPTEFSFRYRYLYLYSFLENRLRNDNVQEVRKFAEIFIDRPYLQTL